MKKNTITKVLLIMVMLLLVFSMFACQDKNKGNDGGSSTKKLDTPELKVDGSSASWNKPVGTEKFCVYIYDSDKNLIKTLEDYAGKTYELQEGEEYIEVVAIPKSSAYAKSDKSPMKQRTADTVQQLVNLLNGVQGFVDVWNAIEVNDTLSADIALGGFFTSGTGDLKKENTIALSAKANAGKTDPEFMIDFKLNGTDYVSLGFKDNAILVREPLNYVNKSGVTAANAFKIDVSALGSNIPVMMGAAMKLISIEDVELEEITGAAKTFLKSGFGVDIIKLTDEGDKKTLSITIETLQALVDLVDNIPQAGPIVEKIDGYLGKYYDIADAVKMQPILLDGKQISWSAISEKITKANKDGKLINIEMTFSGNNIKKLDLVLDLAALEIANLDNTVGLSIGLETFVKATSSSQRVNINADGFTAQNLEIDLGAALGVKDLAADAKATIRLADAFANKNNKWATLTVTDKQATATAYIDATGAYADFGPVFTMVGGDKGELKTKYEAKFKNDQNEDINLVDTINTAINKTFTTTVVKKLAELEIEIAERKANKDKQNSGNTDSGNTSSGESSGESQAQSSENGSDFMSFIMDVAKGFGTAQDKIDYACSVIYPFIERFDSAATAYLPDVAENKKGPATQATVIKYAFERTLGDTDSCVADYALFYQNATTFKGLWDNIKACHEAGKDALDAATGTTSTTAGVQLLLAGDDNDLLDYVAKFVKVPTISENPDTHEDEPDFTNLVAINDKDNLIAWLNWIFPVDNEYRVMVEDILGIELVDIIDGGIYCEAINLGGYNGAIRIASGSDAQAEGYKSYVYVNAGFGMKASVADSMAAIEAEVAFNAPNEGEYYIAEMADALLTALRAY